jgi:hypothetical protein
MVLTLGVHIQHITMVIVTRACLERRVLDHHDKGLTALTHGFGEKIHIARPGYGIGHGR